MITILSEDVAEVVGEGLSQGTDTEAGDLNDGRHCDCFVMSLFGVERLRKCVGVMWVY